LEDIYRDRNSYNIKTLNIETMRKGYDRKRSKRYIYMTVFVASIGGFLFGFDLVVIAGALPFIEQAFHLTPAMKGFAVSSAILGSMSGPLIGLWFTERVGRRMTMMLAAVFFAFSTIGTSIAGTIMTFALWRFMGGVGIGLAMMSSPIYIAELSPPNMRGVLVNINQLSNVIGINLAVMVSYVFSSKGWGWQWMFASQAVPVILLFIGLLLIPESPRWLASKNRALEAFEILSTINGDEVAKKEIGEIKSELSLETGGIRELLQSGVKRALFIGVVLMIFSQINGVNMMLLYAPTILADAGIKFGSLSILSSIPIYLLILVTTIISFRLIKRFSRRGLLITSVLCMAAGHLLMAINLFNNWNPLFTIIPMLIGAGSFTLGFAPLSWVIVSEIFPNKVRSIAFAVVCFFLYAASFVTAQIFPIVTEWFDKKFHNAGGVYLIFAGVCLLCALFSWKMVPETKGLSLERISSFWQDRQKERKFSIKSKGTIV